MKYIAAVAFVATVYAANWAVTHYGIVNVGFSLMAPAGVWFAGVGFLLRDWLHELAGRLWVLGAIIVGAALSYWLGVGDQLPGGHVSLALASALAFGLSELADFAVYTPLRDKTLAGAVALSQIVGSAVDSAAFLFLAFGSLAFFWGQFVAKAYLTIPALLLLAAWKTRKRLQAA